MYRYTVLIVEDDPAFRELLVTALNTDACSILEAADGLQAIQLLDEQRVSGVELDLILLDLMLPHLDGLAVLNHVTAHCHSAAVVAISASQWYLQAAKASGAKVTMQKPFKLDELVGLVERYCAKAA
jgi:two-component system response regulator HydG